MASASVPESNQESRKNNLSLAVLGYVCLSSRVSSVVDVSSIGRAVSFAVQGCAGAWLGSFALSSIAERERKECSALRSWEWHSAGTLVPFFIEDILFPSWCTSEALLLSRFLAGFSGDRALPVRLERSLGVT